MACDFTAGRAVDYPLPETATGRIWRCFMGMVKVTCQIEDYSESRKESLKIHSHWNIKRFVELEIDGKRYTVNGNDLKTAIDNCMNTGV